MILDCAIPGQGVYHEVLDLDTGKYIPHVYYADDEAGIYRVVRKRDDNPRIAVIGPDGKRIFDEYRGHIKIVAAPDLPGQMEWCYEQMREYEQALAGYHQPRWWKPWTWLRMGMA